ncbi:MAG TPA: MBL fold metallo-hydrolase [Phycisphaerales bacterium]|nr:MBL fold metallo-hydrolase [Phycisphaerales bacterium]
MPRQPDHPEPLMRPLDGCVMQLCVLSSSSSGNCSALLVGQGDARRLYLIDLGLSPRRTRLLLAQVGLAGVPVHGVLLTHLDADHWRPTWVNALPETAPIFVHRRHRGRAGREGVTHHRTELFEGDFDLPAAGGAPVYVRCVTNPHDDLGSVAFRFMLESAPGDLGYATDIGTPTRTLSTTLAGVDVLALESNYCPRMQEASARPESLKDRIMGGSGHLSNEQSAQLVRDIAPRSHVVLLHLSRQCNHPETALRHHQHAPVKVTLAMPDAPTPWLGVSPGGGAITSRRIAPATLFGHG